ncbi:MAG: lactate racemase domain-containing protein [Candidatus Sumerlaeia bacterium]|nr:lactate racemase domain-containing protein [Candidatus Sumerlaeia bacterium]
MVIGKGSEKVYLSENEVREIVREAASAAAAHCGGRRILAIVPDHTRTAPIAMMFRLFHEAVAPVARQIDVLIALGTHPAEEDEKIEKILGFSPSKRPPQFQHVQVFNHEWNNPDALCDVGVISADEIHRLSHGMLREPLPVRLNRRILDYDRIVIIGPTFPHEVVGFSGGNKYLFPGISGPDVINLTHWIGALNTNVVINGTKQTPVRDIINRAASLISVPRLCFSLVCTHEGLHGVYFGAPEEAYDAAADLSAKVHIVWKDRPFHSVLSMAPPMYDDLWVGGKCMYKLEPVIADGGELIIYAPHIAEVSFMHGEYLDRVGYHCRDYFLKQMDKFRDVPLAILAHSTHVKGAGTFEDGVERPRVHVTLATGISEERCRRINLGWRDWRTIDPKQWEGREDEGLLLVPNAGEMLFRLRK